MPVRLRQSLATPPSARAPVPSGSRREGKTGREAWEGGEERPRLAPGEPIDTTLRRRPGPASLGRSIRLFVIQDLLEMVTGSVPPESSIIRPDGPLSALTVGGSRGN